MLKDGRSVRCQENTCMDICLGVECKETECEEKNPNFMLKISIVLSLSLPQVSMREYGGTETYCPVDLFPVNSGGGSSELLKQNTFLIFLPQPKNINFRTLFLPGASFDED